MNNGTKIAINKVQKILCENGGISKDQQAPAQAGGFAFRGIDDLYNFLGPQVAEAGLILSSFDIESHVCNTIAARNGSKLHWILTVKWVFGCLDDDSTCEYKTIGEAMDKGDKGLNKALTSAFKNLIFPVFIIPVEKKQDSENEDHEISDNAVFKDDKGWSNLSKMLTGSAYLISFNQTLAEIANRPIAEWDMFIKEWKTHVAKQKESAIDLPKVNDKRIQEHKDYQNIEEFLTLYNIENAMNAAHPNWRNWSIDKFEECKKLAIEISENPNHHAIRK